MVNARRNLHDCHSIADLRELARRRLPRPVFDFMDGAAETETTARRNISAFERVSLIPRHLVDVAAVSTSTHVLGQHIEWPVFCAPTGVSRFFHPDGEQAVARAAAKAGTIFGLSTNATVRLEDVAAIGPAPKMFQLYIFKDRGLVRELIRRSKAAGYGALCLTVDVPVPGKRERDLRSGFGVPIRLSFDLIASFAQKPMWALSQGRKGRISVPHLEAWTNNRSLVKQTEYMGQQLNPSVTWEDVVDVIKQWNGPFALKGIMRSDDARRAADAGATAVIVSNHGGRQLDGAASTFEVLPEITEAVGDRIEVILDGGIRRGVDVLKALALGAKACSIGRPYLYGLAAGGEAGVTRALDILKAEFVRAMQFTGCKDVESIRDVRMKYDFGPSRYMHPQKHCLSPVKGPL